MIQIPSRTGNPIVVDPSDCTVAELVSKDLHRHVFLENHVLFAKYQRIAGFVS